MNVEVLEPHFRGKATKSHKFYFATYYLQLITSSEQGIMNVEVPRKAQYSAVNKQNTVISILLILITYNLQSKIYNLPLITPY
jgi:hypothetical protein